MTVKKPIKKKAAKKKAKPRIKTAVCHETNVYEVYEGYLECPYCGENTNVESNDAPPEKDTCYSCGKEFKIKWEEL